MKTEPSSARTSASWMPLRDTEDWLFYNREKLVSRIIASSKAEHTEVLLTSTLQLATRWSNNAINQNVCRRQDRLTVTTAFGKCVGSASTNRLDAESLREVVQRAQCIARASQPDTEYLPPPRPMSYPQVSAFSEATADATPRQLARAIEASVFTCATAGLRSAGVFTVECRDVTVANSQGLFATHPSTHARFVCTVMSDNASGWAEAIANDMREINHAETTRIAMQQCLAAAHPIDVKPGAYTVILAPAAVAELLAFMLWSMDAKSAHEGRSAFAGKEGTSLGAECVTIRSQPEHPVCPGVPFFDDGMAVPTVTWVERGVLKNLCYSRFWAQVKSHPFTGPPTNLIMQGAETPSDFARNQLTEIIGSTKIGLLVTRFWYVRWVDPMKLLLTGMTRDGLFLIREGEIVAAVKHLRFNETPFNMLRNIEMLGVAQRCGEYLPCHVPRLKVRDFTFTSAATF